MNLNPNPINFYKDAHFRQGYDPSLGVFQAKILHAQIPNQVKGTGHWGVVNLQYMPAGYNFGTEYTQTHAIGGKLTGVPSFNPFNSDPRFLTAFQNEMLFNQGKINELSDQDKKTLNEAHRNTFLWAKSREKHGLPATFIPGVDDVNYSFPQKYGDNDDEIWTTYNSGHAKLYKNGKLIPEDEALSLYQDRVNEMNELYNQGRDQEADKMRSTLEKQILYGSPSANKTKVWDRTASRNREKYKDYKQERFEDVEAEFGNEYEDSTKETDELIQEKQQEEKYKNIMNGDSLGLQF